MGFIASSSTAGVHSIFHFPYICRMTAAEIDIRHEPQRSRYPPAIRSAPSVPPTSHGLIRIPRRLLWTGINNQGNNQADPYAAAGDRSYIIGTLRR